MVKQLVARRVFNVCFLEEKNRRRLGSRRVALYGRASKPRADAAKQAAAAASVRSASQTYPVVTTFSTVVHGSRSQLHSCLVFGGLGKETVRSLQPVFIT